MTDADRRISNAFRGRLGAVAAMLVVVCFVVVTLRALGSFMQPLFVAIFFYYVGAPLTRLLRRWRVPTALANLAPIAIAVAVLGFIAWIIAEHVDDMRELLPEYGRQLLTLVRSSTERLNEVQPTLGALVEKHAAEILGPGGPANRVVGVIVGGFVGWTTMALLIIVFLVFLNFEAVTLPRRLVAALGEQRAASILEFGRNTNSAIIRYVYVKGLASLLVALSSSAVMFAVGLDMAALWGALTFFGNFIPYVGSLVAVILPVTVAVLQFGSVPGALGLCAVLVAFQGLVAQFVEPRFAGRQLNLSPLVVILSLAFWGWLWGVIGLLLSIPIMVSLRLSLENLAVARPVAVLLMERPPKERPAGLQAREPAPAAGGDEAGGPAQEPSDPPR